jgi:hypothetical protein
MESGQNGSDAARVSLPSSMYDKLGAIGENPRLHPRARSMVFRSESARRRRLVQCP